MDTTHVVESFRPNVSIRSVGLVFLLSSAITASELLIFFGFVGFAIWAYTILLIGFSLAPILIERDTTTFQAFALIPIFRLANLAMPIFFELTLFWLPLIYGPLIPVFVYLGRRGSLVETTPGRSGGWFQRFGLGDGGQRAGIEILALEPMKERDPRFVRIGHDLPWWLGGNGGGSIRRLLIWIRRVLTAPEEEISIYRKIYFLGTRLLFVALLPVAAGLFLLIIFGLTVYLAELEYGIITPKPLISSLTLFQLGVLALVMIGFVGFVEELLFRGVLQKVLERRLGLVPGLLLASVIFGLMHSVQGIPMEIVMAATVGVIFGIVYDITDSLVLVSVMHGVLNVFLFGIIPLDGGSAIDLLQTITVGQLQRHGLGWLAEVLIDLVSMTAPI